MKKRCIMPNIVFCVVCVVFILPLFMIISLSLTKEADIAAYGYRIIPQNITLDAYKFVFNTPEQIITSYKNSIIVTAVGSVISLFLTCCLGYVMSRRDFALSKFLIKYVLFAMLFRAGMIPTYIVISQVLNLSNTRWVLILPMLMSPWNLFLMKSYMQSIPMEVIEAASIDGSSELSTFFRIILPLSKPGMATVGLLTVFAYWNDWWLGMMYVDNMNLVPLQSLLYRIISNIQFLAKGGLGTMTISSAGLPTLSARMATCVIAIAPMMIIFPFFQKYLVKGLMVGSVKG